MSAAEWRNSEYSRFKDHLSKLEQKKLVEIDKIRQIEIKLKLKLQEIEEKEREFNLRHNQPNEIQILKYELEKSLDRERILVKSREHFRLAVLRSAYHTPNNPVYTETFNPPKNDSTPNRTNTFSSEVPKHEYTERALPKHEFGKALRARLLRSGMYTETDPLIRQMDAQLAIS